MLRKQILVVLFLIFMLISLFETRSYVINNIVYEQVSIESPSEIHFFNVEKVGDLTDIKSIDSTNYYLNGYNVIKCFSISNYTGCLMIDFSNIIVETRQSDYLFFKMDSKEKFTECNPIKVKLYEYIDEDCVIGVMKKE